MMLLVLCFCFTLGLEAKPTQNFFGRFLGRARQMLQWNLALMFTYSQYTVSFKIMRVFFFFFPRNGGD